MSSTTPKYPIGTTFEKEFPPHGRFQGQVMEYDASSQFYFVRYEDGDEEELEQSDLDQLLPKTKGTRKRKNSPETVVQETTTTRSGRATKKTNYAEPLDLEEEDDEEEEDFALPTSSSNNEESEALVMEHSDNDEDDDDNDDNDSSNEEEEPSPARRTTKGRARQTKPTATTKSGGKMYKTWTPKNAPIYPNFSLSEIQQTKNYLDPCGMEATDDIIGRIVGDQVSCLGPLLVRTLASSNSNAPWKRAVGEPWRLGTACSGTDAPALALTLVQEQLQQRLGPLLLLENGKVETKTDMSDKDAMGGVSNKKVTFDFVHEFSCENEPFKLAYLARNFDSTLYPDISKLCDEKPRDVYGQVKPIPPVNLFVAGTSCKNFSMLAATKRKDIEDRGCSGETFLAAVEYVLKFLPQVCILENVCDAPWPKMSEYITGRVKLSDCDSTKSIGGKKDSSKKLIFSFDSEEQKIVVEQVPAYFGVQCGSTVAGFLKGQEGKVHPVQWAPNISNKKTCTLEELMKRNKISKANDTLVLDRQTIYCTRHIKVDTKFFGLPQTRERTYMLAWQAERQELGYFFHDNLGDFWATIVHFLQSPVQHSLEAFVLQEDHDVIRNFREALRGPPGRETKQSIFLQPDFWTSTSSNLPHNKSVRKKAGITDMSRFITNWGPYGKKSVAPHYWLEYLDCNPQRELDMIDILHAEAARDAMTFDSNYACFYWNISQNATREPHRAMTPGIAGCVTPGGDILLPHLGRPLLGCEKLLLQGIPYFRLMMGNETEVQLGDLAGNAMSLPVVSAAMLAAMVAPQLREEMRNSTGTKHCNVKDIHPYLDKTCSQKNASPEWTGKISLTKSSLVEKNHGDQPAANLFKDLVKLAPDAVRSSIWCTCESSGSMSQTNEFVQCATCAVRCCRNCISERNGYNLSTHCTVAIPLVSNSETREPGAFESTLRSVLPPSLYLTKDHLDVLVGKTEDEYRINGLSSFSFGLHRIKSGRGKWMIEFYARDSLGTAVAELRITLGEVRRAQISEVAVQGLRCELTCFMPALTKPFKFGKLPPCCQLLILYGDSATPCWKVKMPNTTSSIKITGNKETPSHRVDVGLTEVAEKSLLDSVKVASKAKQFSAAVKRGEKRKWLYAKNWQKWPEIISVSSSNSQISGLFTRAKCRHTTNQSALWIKDCASDLQHNSTYLLLKPNVSRLGFDQTIISTSMDHNDTCSILAEFDSTWQPCDAFDESKKLQTVCCSSWHEIHDFDFMVPSPSVQVSTCAKGNNLVVVSGLRESEIAMLLGSDTVQTSECKLNVTSGQQAQQIVRALKTTIVAPVLKFIASGKLNKYDLKPDGSWIDLPQDESTPFGLCKRTVPERPRENWSWNEEFQRNERTSDPGASRKYFLALQSAQKPFDFVLNAAKGSLDVKMFPTVVAHNAAAQLLRGRGITSQADKFGGLCTLYRLLDALKQPDPVINRFAVRSCDSQARTSVRLEGNYKLYPRQERVVTMMLDIEQGKSVFLEEEIAEANMPGSTNISLIAKASRERQIPGGVIADAIGAGKTVISIAIILQGIQQARSSRSEPRKSGATLVIVPPALIDQWKAEIDKFCGNGRLKVILVHGTSSIQKLALSSFIKADVIVAPVDILQDKGYLQNLFQLSGIEEQNNEVPKLPPYSGQPEQNAARGRWIPHTSADPYAGGKSPHNQKRRDQSAYFTHVYHKAIGEIRKKTFPSNQKGVPLEYFEFERIFVDEIHESLCTTKVEIKMAKDKAKDSARGFFEEKNRRAGRELLGICQSDVSKRPLVCRRAVFGLTGTPLLDSNSRVIELANLMGGLYLAGLWSHWRQLERQSSQQIFLHQFLEPKRSRFARQFMYEKSQQFVRNACCRNKVGDEMNGISLSVETIAVNMTLEEKELYLASQSGIEKSQRSLAIGPADFDPALGQSVYPFLRQNAAFVSRKHVLVGVCKKILEEAPTTKIVVFADGRIGAGFAVRDALNDDGLGCTWIDLGEPNEERNKKISWYQKGDATEEDRKRPRVLVLHFEHAAGLNLQHECHNLILYSPLYTGSGGTNEDPVADVSTEQQAIGRVFRAGQPSPVVKLYRIEVKGPGGEDVLDSQVLKRNTNQEYLSMATNADGDSRLS